MTGINSIFGQKKMKKAHFVLIIILMAGISLIVVSTNLVFATPIIYMQDTTNSGGQSLYSGRQIHAEYVSSTSSLVGQQIDSITVQLRRNNAPTGTMEIGVFNTNLTAKKVFGTKDVSTIAGTNTVYEFKLNATDTPYKIQVDDRIGVKYTGGDNTTNYVVVIRDTDAADPFDGTNSYHTYYDTAWRNFTANDLYMTLQWTNPPEPVVYFQNSYRINDLNGNVTKFLINSTGTTVNSLILNGPENANGNVITSLGAPTSSTDAQRADRLGLLGNLVQAACSDDQSLIYQLANATWICGTRSTFPSNVNIGGNIVSTASGGSTFKITVPANVAICIGSGC